jgi:hypothetical protein
MLDLQPRGDGTVLPVRAQPGARGNAIRGVQQGALRVSVTQSPEKGKANKAMISLLAELLSLRKSQIELLSGATSPQKRFLIRGLTPAELARRIEAVLSR